MPLRNRGHAEKLFSKSNGVKKMGYTNYWNNPEFTDVKWDALCIAAGAILTHSGICSGWDGSGTPEITATEISFNGTGEDSHETFCITKAASEFTFCKTARKPYDAVCLAVLMCAALIGKLDYSSDGDGEEGHGDAARAIVQAAVIRGDRTAMVQASVLTGVQS